MERRTDLDWLRIAAFGLLIFYHVGMFYVTWDWHVKSSRASAALEPLMLAVNPWRLLLLFVISGAATRFMADKMAPLAFLGSRTARLLSPLLFAVFVVVPPQSYLEIVEQINYTGGFGDFYERYVTGSGHWRHADELIVTPTYNHMWFVAYLFLYTLAVSPLLPLLRRIPARPLSLLIDGPLVILVPAFVLWLGRVLLFPAFGETHDFRDDWYLHATYFAAFLFGFAIAKHQPFFEACVRWRHPALQIAAGAFAVRMWARGIFLEKGAPLPDWAPLVGPALQELQAWGAIVALIGFAHLHLRGAEGPVRRYLTEAIFPFYIVHQTIIVAAGHFLDPLGWPVGLEALTLVALTAVGSVLTYEIARRLGPLRPLFGLKLRATSSKHVEAAHAEGHISFGR